MLRNVSRRQWFKELLSGFCGVLGWSHWRDKRCLRVPPCGQPSGYTTTFSYDGSLRLACLAAPYGVMTYTYDPASGVMLQTLNEVASAASSGPSKLE